MLFAVDHPSLPPFEPIIRSIVRMAFTGGLQALASLGVTMEAVKTDPKARSRFLRGCHRGYDKAQQQIGAYLIEMEGRVDALEAESKALRASRDPARRETELRIRVVRNRQLVLRRLADAILCAITHFDTWVIKRLILDRHLRSIDPRVLRKTIQVATQRNADNRLRFSLVADLTTIVQIGDLVEISFDSRDPRWKVIELKEGRVNEVLSGLLGQTRSESDQVAVQDEIRVTMGKHAAKQAERMRRQIVRLERVEEIIATDKGVDPAFDMPIVITPDAVVTESYDAVIADILGVAAKDGFGAASLSGCLHLLALRKDYCRDDYLGSVAHAFFHMRGPAREFMLTVGTDDGVTEWNEVREGPPFVDLVAHSMHAQWGRPVFLWVAPEVSVSLVTGEYRLFAQFDIEAFFGLAEKHGIKMTWVTGKAAEELKRLRISEIIPGSPGARGVKALMPDGTTQTLLSGAIARVIADLTTPQQLLELVNRGPAQAEKMGVTLE